MRKDITLKNILIAVTLFVLWGVVMTWIPDVKAATSCSVQVSPGHPSGNSQCFMDEVMTGEYAGQAYCSRIYVFCN